MSLAMRRFAVLVATLGVLACGVSYGLSRSLESPTDVVLSGFLLLTFQQTVYAPQYSDEGFRHVKPGMSTTDVEGILGVPLSQIWLYEGCPVVWLKDSRIMSLGDDRCPWPNGRKPSSIGELLKIRGEPQQMIWAYSTSPNESSFHDRRVYFERHRVSKKEATVYLD